MEFEHEAHWALYEHIRDLLDREFGPAAQPTEDDPAIVVELNDRPIAVSVGGAGPGTSVTIYARPATEVEVTPEVALFLLRSNFDSEIPFGSLGLNAHDAITLSHVLMGEGLDDDAFIFLLQLIAGKLENLDTVLGQMNHSED